MTDIYQAGTQTVELRKNTELHRSIVAALNVRKTKGLEANNKRSAKWNAAEEQFLAYTPAKEADEEANARRRAGKQTEYSTLVIPYSLATLLAAHTYWSSVFLSRDPVLQYEGMHGAADNSVLAVEAIMSYNVNAGGMLMPFYNWLYQPGKYGQGILGLRWDADFETISSIEMQQPTLMGIPIPNAKPKKVRRIQQIPGYCGNRVFNIQPQKFLFDPRVPISNLQNGEFAGYLGQLSWNEIVKGESVGIYFNVEFLRTMTGQGSTQDTYGSAQVDRPDNGDFTNSTRDIKDLGVFDMYVMIVELIPADWKLGQSTLPEKWAFTVVKDQVIISARPYGEMHNHFPFYVLEYEIDPFALFNRSMLEVIQPLQNTLDFLFNSRMFNVRSSLNNMLVYDPTRVVAKDILNPEPGMRIRLRPEAYGTDVRAAVSQISVQDITQSNMQDARVVLDFIQRATGVNDNIMGAVNSGGRKSATEARQSSTFGINRLKTIAEIMSAQGWDPLSYDMLKSVQQHYDGQQKFRIAGDVLEGVDPFVQVTPETIAGSFGWIPVDGTMPIDRYAQANLIRQFVSDIAKSPQIAPQYDLAGLAGYAMKLAGMKGINRFRVQVVPDEQVMNAARQGNLVPGVGTGGGNIVPLNPDGNAPEPKQVEGIGRTL